MQHSPREHPVTLSPTYSTLPELAKCELPEVVFDPDNNLPETLVAYELPSEPPYRLPSSKLPVQGERKAQCRHPCMRLLRRKRNYAFIVVILLVFFGVLIGIIVSIVGRQVQSRPQTEEDNTNSLSSSLTITTSSTPIPPSVPSMSFAFGTPTSFPSPSVDKPLASVCQGTVCPQMFTSARLATSLNNPSMTYLFARGHDNAIWHRAINESQVAWNSEWESLGGNFLSQPGAMSCAEGRIDVFAVWTEDRSMRTKTFQNGVWSTEWLSLGGQSAAPPAVCGFFLNNINVVTINKDDHTVHQKFSADGRTFGPTSQESNEWRNLGGPFSSVSSADFGCSQTLDPEVLRHNVVAYGKDSSGNGGDNGFGIYFLKYNTTVYWETEWTRGQGEYRGDPVLVSTIDRTHFFGVGVDMAIWFTNWTSATGYSSPVSLSKNLKFQSVVSALITGSSSRVDVLAVGTDGRLKHKTCIGGTWGTEWEDLGGYFNSSPKAVQLSGRTVVVFGIGPNGAVIHSTFEIGTGYTWGSGQWYTDGGQISTEWYRNELIS